MNDREIGVQFPAKARGFPLLRPDWLWEISAYKPIGNEEGCGTWSEINQTDKTPTLVRFHGFMLLKHREFFFFTVQSQSF